MALTPEQEAILAPRKTGPKTTLTPEEKSARNKEVRRAAEEKRGDVIKRMRTNAYVGAVLEAQARHKNKTVNRLLQEMILEYHNQNPIPKVEE